MGQVSNRNGRPPSQRMLQVGEKIRRSLSAILQRGEIHDSDLQRMILTVSEVKMSSDLRVATAYVLPLGGKEQDDALKALRRNTVAIRHLVVKGGRQKVAPEIRFEIDSSFDQMDATRAILESDRVQRDLDKT